MTCVVTRLVICVMRFVVMMMIMMMKICIVVEREYTYVHGATTCSGRFKKLKS